MLIKSVIFALILVILFCLGSGLFYLVKAKDDSTHVVTALTWRIGLSIALFVLLLVAFSLGWIKPHGL
ncbi:MAG: twin transmembrane helix small protein [Gammaproteobacteria bacterium]|nr:twin transmembrane helix small protein [Gammaproteobacteria bacterium]